MNGIEIIRYEFSNLFSNIMSVDLSQAIYKVLIAATICSLFAIAFFALMTRRTHKEWQNSKLTQTEGDVARDRRLALERATEDWKNLTGNAAIFALISTFMLLVVGGLWVWQY